jgi:tetratricopeptide (TPR) repeat protein
MYCPECGADAGAGNFCPDCGADLRDAGASPDCTACGAELPEGARFCPECGEPSGAGGGARAEKPAAAAGGGGRRTGTRGKSAGAGQQRQQRAQQPRSQQAAKAKQGRQPGRVSPAVAWALLGAVVVVAVVVVILFARDAGDSPSVAATTPASSGSVQAVAADTSGSYSELVQRANGLYDQGAAQLQAKDFPQASEYFLAASKVYAAAWKQQATDPAVGTDFATSLFYAGKIDAAVEQVELVLSKSPDFQTAWFNKGNYLAERARQAEQAGSKQAATKDYAAAKVAYQKAIDLDPTSASAQQAKEQLATLPQ